MLLSEVKLKRTQRYSFKSILTDNCFPNFEFLGTMTFQDLNGSTYSYYQFRSPNRASDLLLYNLSEFEMMI